MTSCRSDGVENTGIDTCAQANASACGEGRCLQNSLQGIARTHLANQIPSLFGLATKVFFKPVLFFQFFRLHISRFFLFQDRCGGPGVQFRRRLGRHDGVSVDVLLAALPAARGILHESSGCVRRRMYVAVESGVDVWVFHIIQNCVSTS